ncbi:MAG: diguanylate cyclase [Desulfobacteraceae bacterium]|nr:diguanylate cyclase [Desulfobacteraceae bacterium]
MNKFSGLTIATKMTVGYLPLALIIILLSLYTLSSLNELSDINRGIVNNNMAIIEACDNLTDSLLAQEAYGQRYLILKSEEMLTLFSKRDIEFERILRNLANVPESDEEKIKRIKSLHDNYNSLYFSLFDIEEAIFKQTQAAEEEKIKKSLDTQFNVIKTMMFDTKKSLEKKTIQANTFSKKAFYVAAFLSLLGIVVGIGAALLITRNVARSINQLKLAALKFSKHQFDFVPDVNKYDEFGTLAQALTSMAEQLAKLKAMDIDTNPLTRLPGGMAIENFLHQKITNQKEIAFCLLDIDKFKSFNDRYGYARGNDVIKFTGDVIQGIVTEKIESDFFVGHIGGDDFVAVVPPDSFQEICEIIINKFDKNIVKFYDKKDLEKGYIVSKTRQGEISEFPVMSISIAVVTNKDDLSLSSVKIGELAAEIKEYAKTFEGSIYLTDRRKKFDD